MAWGKTPCAMDISPQEIFVILHVLIYIFIRNLEIELNHANIRYVEADQVVTLSEDGEVIQKDATWVSLLSIFCPTWHKPFNMVGSKSLSNTTSGLVGQWTHML